MQAITPARILVNWPAAGVRIIGNGEPKTRFSPQS